MSTLRFPFFASSWSAKSFERSCTPYLRHWLNSRLKILLLFASRLTLTFLRSGHEHNARMPDHGLPWLPVQTSTNTLPRSQFKNTDKQTAEFAVFPAAPYRNTESTQAKKDRGAAESIWEQSRQIQIVLPRKWVLDFPSQFVNCTYVQYEVHLLEAISYFVRSTLDVQVPIWIFRRLSAFSAFLISVHPCNSCRNTYHSEIRNQHLLIVS